MKKGANRTCIICGKEFFNVKYANTCSDNCRAIRNRVVYKRNYAGRYRNCIRLSFSMGKYTSKKRLRENNYPSDRLKRMFAYSLGKLMMIEQELKRRGEWDSKEQKNI